MHEAEGGGGETSSEAENGVGPVVSGAREGDAGHHRLGAEVRAWPRPRLWHPESLACGGSARFNEETLLSMLDCLKMGEKPFPEVPLLDTGEACLAE